MSGGRFAMIHHELVDDARVSRTAGWVYTVLARSARFGVVPMTYPDLAAKARMSRRTAITAVKILAECGYVEVRSSPSGNEYHLPALVAAAGASSARRNGARGDSAYAALPSATDGPPESADSAPASAMPAPGSATAARGSAKSDSQIALPPGRELHYPDTEIAPALRKGDYETNRQDIEERERSLASPIVTLYRELTGHSPPATLGLALEKIAAVQGLDVVQDMMRESFEATGTITPQTLAVSERKLGRATERRALKAPVRRSRASVPAERGAIPPDPQETHPLWRDVLLALRDEVAPNIYTEWCQQTRALGQEGNELRIAVRARFHQNWISTTLGPRAEKVLRRMGQDTITVHFVVQEEAFNVPRSPH